MNSMPQYETVSISLDQEKPGLWKFRTVIIRPDLGGGEAMEIVITRAFNRGPNVSVDQAESEALKAAQKALAKRLEALTQTG